jgi:hypothetical protein
MLLGSAQGDLGSPERTLVMLSFAYKRFDGDVYISSSARRPSDLDSSSHSRIRSTANT